MMEPYIIVLQSSKFVYFTGSNFISTCLKHRGRLALPMNCTGSLMVPEAFEHKFSVSVLLFFLPSADF